MDSDSDDEAPPDLVETELVAHSATGELLNQALTSATSLTPMVVGDVVAGTSAAAAAAGAAGAGGGEVDGEPTGKIPVTIVTGFLGSGKTTLMNYIMTGSFVPLFHWRPFWLKVRWRCARAAYRQFAGTCHHAVTGGCQPQLGVEF
jgi:hypothetical protein